jgi:hypothetical protein
MLRHFHETGFDLPRAAQELSRLWGNAFAVAIDTISSKIETEDLASAYRIAEFMLNLIPTAHPPSEEQLVQYIESHFKRPDGRYRFSCDQDFLTIRRR